MRTEHVAREPSAEREVPAQLLVESQCQPENGTTNHFLRAAQHLAEGGTRTVVFLVDDGISCAVGPDSAAAAVVAAGANVWADDVSLDQRAVSVDQLTAGVLPVTLDKVSPLLFDPAVRVVWH